LRQLASDPRARRQEASFVIEGPTLVADAMAAGIDLEAVFAEPGAPDQIRDAAKQRQVPVYDVVPGALARVVDATTPQPVAAVARRATTTLDDIDPAAPVLVLAGVSDPGNAGTLLRSAEAAGFAAVLFSAGAVDPFSPKCVRASAGSLFRIEVMTGGEAAAMLDELAGRGRRRIGTTKSGGVAYHQADLDGPVAIVLGNEAHGLPAGAERGIDEWVTIPMAGRTESLNVAMAGTLLCFEVARRARGKP
ncbi:MAG: TrmH family RNA methyltransferase, partial [Acidimicrobiales bacterium]